ncbi:MAG TPA: efflux transporter outer membrane subunit [Rickettsiales bacterium]|nr:efflux transporter outer membrane subunit [Rickettsiales bacterium]
MQHPIRKKRSLSLLATSALALCLALPGCKVGPDYHKPNDPLPIGWKQQLGDSKPAAEHKQEPTLDKQALAQLQWWKKFNDPVLDGLIEKGLQQNLDLQIAKARIQEARAALRSAKSDLLPSVDAMASGMREGNQIAFGKTSFPKPFNIFQTGFDASWELDLFGKSRRAIESAFALFGAEHAYNDEVRVSTLAEIARTYMDIRRYQAQVAIAQQSVKAQEETLKIQKDLYAAGSIPETGVIPAQARLMQQQFQVLYYQNLLTTSEYAMDLLLAEQPGTAHGLVAEVKPIPVADKNIVLAAPAEVIANRPDVREAERKFASSVAEIGVAKAQLFPNISISGFFGFLSTTTDKLVSAPNKSWNVGGNLLWPVFNYGHVVTGIETAKAQKNEALATYKKSVIAALVDVESTLSAYTKQEASREYMDGIVKQDAHAADIAQAKYKDGVTSMAEPLEAQQTLYSAQSQLADATANSAQDFIAVYKSLGGGWQEPPKEPAKPQESTQKQEKQPETLKTPAPAPKK